MQYEGENVYLHIYQEYVSKEDLLGSAVQPETGCSNKLESKLGHAGCCWQGDFKSRT